MQNKKFSIDGHQLSRDMLHPFSVRTILYFETIAEHTFGVGDKMTTMDTVVWLYSTIIAADPDIKIQFDDFVTELDTNKDILPAFLAAVKRESAFDNQFLQEEKKKTDSTSTRNE